MFSAVAMSCKTKLLLLCFLISGSTWAAEIDKAAVSVITPNGQHLRAFVTTPRGTASPVGGIFLVGWLSCDSVEYKDGETDGFGALLLRLVARSGRLMFRMEKPGINGSEGVCKDTDFNTELADYRAAFTTFLANPRLDKQRVFVLGLSNGAAIAPLVAQATPIRGYVVSGGWTKTWFEHMLETERKSMTWRHVPPAAVTWRIKLVSQFYSEYLLKRKLPGDVIRENPALAEIWKDEPAHQYGRPAAFYHQLQALNIAEVWQSASAPVLAIHGEYDVLMSAEDHASLASWANQKKAGNGTFLEIPHMSHLLEIYNTRDDMLKDANGHFDDSLVTKILGWMSRVEAR